MNKGTPIREACFLSPDTTAFAAIDAGIHCHFFQHGLLTKNVMIPSFSDVTAITKYEAAYIQEMLGTVKVTLQQLPYPPVKIENRNALLVASGRHVLEEMQLVIPVLQEADLLGLTTYIRPSIGEDLAEFWLSGDAPNVPFEITTPKGSFNHLLNEKNVVYVVSWGSTTLVDALYMGVLPICIGYIENQHVLKDTVYPLINCCLYWPRDQKVIRQAIQSQQEYDRVLTWLRRNECDLCECEKC